MAVFIYLGVYMDWVGEEWGNHKPLMSLASSTLPAPTVDRAHSVAECQKKGPRNEWLVHLLGQPFLAGSAQSLGILNGNTEIKAFAEIPWTLEFRPVGMVPWSIS